LNVVLKVVQTVVFQDTILYIKEIIKININICKYLKAAGRKTTLKISVAFPSW
jgi:hypothetical protein